MEDELLDCRELASRLRVKPNTVREWARVGRIPVIRIGPKVLRFDYAEVVAALRGAQDPKGCIVADNATVAPVAPLLTLPGKAARP